MSVARKGMAVLAIVLGAAAPAVAQAPGYQTSFDDLNGWIPGSTYQPIVWSNDGTPAFVPGGPSRTGPNSLNYNNGTGYDSPGTSNTGVVYSPWVSLAGLASPTLSFWCNFHTQPGSEDAASMRDQRQVAIVPGNSYPLINETLGVTNGGPTLGACSGMGTWHRHVVPLNPAWGVVQVAFVFATVDALDNDNGGWFIDDFAVSEPPSGGGGGTPPPPSKKKQGGGNDRACGLTGAESALLLLGLLALRRR